MDALWVSDARAGKVFSIDLDGKVSIVADVASRPSGLGFLPEGELLVASITQRKILNVSSNKPVVHADMSDIAAGASVIYHRDRNALQYTRAVGSIY